MDVPMFLERNTAGKKYNGQYVIGFDLSDTYSQVSYWKVGTEAPETVSVVNGGQNYNIPTVLCKRNEANQWFYGKDAIKNSEEGEGILLTNLVTQAKTGKSVILEGEEFDPTRLLALFMKRCLSMLNLLVPAEQIVSFMVTTQTLDYRMVEILNEVIPDLQLHTEHVFFQSHTESFYYYMIYQPEELWSQDVLLFDYSQDYLKSYRMERNRHTTPVVAYIERQEFPQFRQVEMPEEENLQQEMRELLDHQFYQIVSDCIGTRAISSAFLIGEGFEGDWLKDSLRVLCNNRRVFQGNNLYSKGACFGAMEKIDQSEIGKQLVFLGNEKLKANVGMKVYRQGKESYLALLDAGVNWFEASRDCEVYLDTGNRLSFLVTPLTGKNVREEEVVLEGLPLREKRTTRIALSMKMLSESRVKLEIKDLGFGQIFPSSGQSWTQEFDL